MMNIHTEIQTYISIEDSSLFLVGLSLPVHAHSQTHTLTHIL